PFRSSMTPPTPTSTLFPYTTLFRSYDMDKARALLADAGWTKNADGVLVNRHGQPFAFELLTNQGNDERKKVAEIVQASLKELEGDRKSTRLNSSHVAISYAVFCLKK